MSVSLPDELRALARHLGVPEGEVDALWVRHQRMVDGDHGTEYGGVRWRGLCERHARDFAQGAAVPSIVRAANEPPMQTRQQEDDAYFRESLTMAEYVASLRGRALLSDAERAFLALCPETQAP